MSDKQVAARYAVSTATIWRWVKELVGFPQPVKLSPGCTRWRVADVEAFENGGALNAGAAPEKRRRGRPRKFIAI